MCSHAVRRYSFPLLLLLLVFAAFGSDGAFSVATAEARQGGPATHIVLFEDGVNPHDALADLGRTHGVSAELVYRHAVNGASIIVPPGRARAISNDPRVAHMEPNLRVTLNSQSLPSGVDRIDGELNSAADIDGVDDVRVDVDVAIIDTGVDLDHPDLNVFASTNCARGGPFGGGCKDGEGDDGNGHGSHVAGTVAALDNSTGVVGLAPGARIWSVRVLDNNGSGYLSWIIGGIDWVTAHSGEIEVANMSLGWQGNSAAVRTAIQNSVEVGVLYVVAAGNESSDVYGDDGTFGTSDDFEPAAYPEVATISGLSDTDGSSGGNGAGSSWAGSDRNSDGIDDGADDSFAFFSNYSAGVVSGNPVTSSGKAIDLILPGVDILSTWRDGGYNTISGTSMASPHGAGLAALHIATNGRASDAPGVYAIRQALIDGGVNQDHLDRGLSILNDPDGNLENIGWSGPLGPVDNPPSVSITSPADGDTISGTVSVIADATDDNGVSQVEFFVDGGTIGVDNDGSDGWSANWDTTLHADGSHTVSVTATDTAGQTSDDSITVAVDNIDNQPSVAITNPADGSTVSGPVSVTADATDDGGVTQVEFFVDGGSIGIDSDGSDGWSASWDSTAYPDGSHTISVTATDTVGQSSNDSVSVTVDNTVPSTMHIGDLDGSSTKLQRGAWSAQVTITVHDGGHGSLANSTVTGRFSQDGWTLSVSCTTDSAGTCTVSSGQFPNNSGNASFTVIGVSHSTLTYDSSTNHDPDGDSDGTTIALGK